jgi:hypothetical protein
MSFCIRAIPVARICFYGGRAFFLAPPGATLPPVARLSPKPWEEKVAFAQIAVQSDRRLL